MRCAVHTDVDATGFCRNCGKALCPACTRDVRGILYCESCLAALVAKPQPVEGAGSPGLAAVLGFIPGLGAVYNGEYLKALIHVIIFGGLIAILESGQAGSYEALFGILLAAFILYMPIEAYRTARAKMLGQAPAGPLGELGANQPIGALVLIGLGVILLLSNFGVLSLGRLLNFWPLVLILLGLLLLLKRMQRTP